MKAATTTIAPARTGVPRSFSALVLVGLAGLAAWMIFSQLGGGAPTASASSEATFEAESGVRIVRVALTAGGGVLDVRFQVVDPSKAGELHDADGRLTLLDEDSGRRMATPFHFHAGGAEYKAGIVYYEMLNNSGGFVDTGDRVSVLMGGARLEHVPVQ
jgi:hypothetical protein